MREAVTKKEVPHCPQCTGLVKPDIVFFGEALPEAFHRNRSLPADADLAIVLGTSLTVQPFASLPAFVTEPTPRLLINLERVGGLGSRADDVLLLGECDKGVLQLVDALGWREELEEEWAKTETEEDKKSRLEKETQPPKTKDEKVQAEIDTLTKDIEASLKLSADHKQRVESTLADTKPDPEAKGGDVKPDSPEEVRVDKDAQPTFIDGNGAEGAREGEIMSAPRTDGDGNVGLEHVFPYTEDTEKEQKPSL